MSRPRSENAVTARICVLYGDFSGRSDSRFRSSINLGFRRGGPAGILKANGADQKARQILTGGLGLGKAVGIPPQVRGERIGVGWLCSSNRVYPRTYGANSTVPAVLRSSTGIPPHTRGRLSGFGFAQQQDGNTPAHTGTTYGASPSESSAHGGQRLGLGASPMVTEYPRTRGDNRLSGGLVAGNTPAHAGTMIRGEPAKECPRTRQLTQSRSPLGIPPRTTGTTARVQPT